jgi:uncharacterized membrane protein
VLMTTFLREAGIEIEPIHVAVWGIPTAICAFLVHGFRLYLLDRKLDRELRGNAASQAAAQTSSATGDQV